MSEVAQDNVLESSNKLDQWFESLIESIKIDHLQLQTKTATDEKTRMYANLIDDRYPEMVSNMRNLSSQFFIEELIRNYLTELYERNVSTSKLAFELSDAKVLVWAEIEDFDESSEEGLILAEAKINAQFSKHGFHISSTIIEKGDNLLIPPHYSSINK